MRARADTDTGTAVWQANAASVLMNSVVSRRKLLRPPRSSGQAPALAVSPAYLSDTLRTLTGRTTQQHIQYGLTEKAKRLLLATSFSISETAFQLGFEYPQYFSRLFERKTGLTPAAFRAAAA